MDSIIVYPGQIPLDVHLLGTERNAVTALAAIVRLVLGTATAIDGLECTPAITGLGVVVAPGSIFSVGVVDQLGLGTLAADMRACMNVGTNLDSTQFALTAPTTPGQAINYVIEALFADAAGTPVVLPYYNAANAQQPMAGPGGGGASQNTLRTQRVALQLKAGAPANLGTQPTPAADAGWTALYVVTVNYGAAAIVQSAIAAVPGAPWLPNKLPGLRKRVSGPLTLYVSNAGNDAWGGTTPATAFLTIQAALASASTLYDLSGNTLVVSLANGVYAGATVYGPALPFAVSIVGNVANPALVVVNAVSGVAIAALQFANVTVSGLTLEAGGSSGTTRRQGSACCRRTGRRSASATGWSSARPPASTWRRVSARPSAS